MARSWPLPFEQRLFAKVDKDVGTDCWLWTGSLKDGYGKVWRAPRPVFAHRAVYELFVGPIPDGTELDHLCHSRDATCAGGLACPHRRCVNPAHLEPVSRAENQRRGQGFAGRQSRQTHCVHGHPFDETNTYAYRGHRLCRACGARRVAARRIH